MKNNDYVWTQQFENANIDDNEEEAKTKKKVKTTLKPLFTAGKGKKCTFGNSTWNDEGKEFFRETMETWKCAFDKNDVQYRCLRRHWDRWIETAGMNMHLDLAGLQNKTMYDLLRVREEGEVVPSRKKKRSAEVDDSEEFEYESDPDDEAVDIGGWSNRRTLINECGDDADEDGGDDEHTNNGGNEDDDDDDDDEFLSSTSKELLDDEDRVQEKSRSRGVMNRKAPSIALDSGDISSDEEEEKSIGVFQKKMEIEAKAAGMTTRRAGKRETTEATSNDKEDKCANKKRQTAGNKGGWKTKRGKKGEELLLEE